MLGATLRYGKIYTPPLTVTTDHSMEEKQGGGEKSPLHLPSPKETRLEN